MSQLRSALTRSRRQPSGRADRAAARGVEPGVRDPVGAARGRPAPRQQKNLVHAELGEIRVHCQMLLAPDQAQALLIFTATPGSESYEKLQLLSVIGTQTMTV